MSAEQNRRNRQRHAHRDLNCPTWQPGDNTRTEPRADAEAAIIETSVAGPTRHDADEDQTLRTVGTIWPTFSVPGINSSATTRRT
jgi:hypothetical protein